MLILNLLAVSAGSKAEVQLSCMYESLLKQSKLQNIAYLNYDFHHEFKKNQNTDSFINLVCSRFDFGTAYSHQVIFQQRESDRQSV